MRDGTVEGNSDFSANIMYIKICEFGVWGYGTITHISTWYEFAFGTFWRSLS